MRLLLWRLPAIGNQKETQNNNEPQSDKFVASGRESRETVVESKRMARNLRVDYGLWTIIFCITFLPVYLWAIITLHKQMLNLF